ncbi:serine protease [Streptomyces sp. NPDC057074]|uniref:S1 family peptidase n=1 Tax=Streptomyces sp. NPDC057074 TaxID=3346015 RepID=UPI0036323F42
MIWHGQLVLTLARTEGGTAKLLGSCFPVNSEYLATAFHVVQGSDRNLVASFPAISNISDYQDTSIDYFNGRSVKIVASDPIRDLCLLKIPDGWSATIPYRIGGTDALHPGSEVNIYGYPHMEFGRRVMTLQRSHVGAKILLSNQGIKSKHVVINSHLRPGQSGGPIFDAHTGTLCAVAIGSYAPSTSGSIIVAGVDPTTLHQTGHAVSAEYLKGMIA